MDKYLIIFFTNFEVLQYKTYDGVYLHHASIYLCSEMIFMRFMIALLLGILIGHILSRDTCLDFSFVWKVMNIMGAT